MKQLLLTQGRRLVVAVVGATVVVLGVIMIFAPGPGWATVFLGLAILATEFAWAQRLLARCKQTAVNARDRVLCNNSATNGGTQDPTAPCETAATPPTDIAHPT